MEEKFAKLLELEYYESNIFLLLGERVGATDPERGIEIVTKGRELYPDNFQLVITAANIFLSNDKTEQALEALETAIDMDDTNHTIFHNVGIMYDLIFTNEGNTEEVRFAAFEKSIDAYSKAIDINSEFFDSQYNLGAINFNKGVYYLEKADALPLGDKNYDIYKEIADKCMVNALPYLEIAVKMQPENVNTLYSLKQIYSRNGDSDSYKAVDDKLKALQK